MNISKAKQLFGNKALNKAELLEQCHNEFKTHEEELNAFITPMFENRKPEPPDGKPLSGIPIAIKDNIAIEDVRLTCGSKMLGDYKSLFSATAIKLLEESGAVFVGKTNLDEFAMGASGEYSAFGASKNPIDTTLVPGGSSSGSAVAVASGMALGALGSDTGGSVRQPASFCGLVGIRPTYGTVSRYGLVAFASSLDQIGTLANTVDDAMLLLKTIQKFDLMDSTSVENISKPITPIKSATIGIPKQLESLSIDPEIQNRMNETRKILEAKGAKFIEIDIPHLEHSVPTYQLIAPSECSANLSRFDGVRYGMSLQNDDLGKQYLETRTEGFGEEVRRRILVGTYALSEGFYDAYYIQACKMRAKISEELFKALEICDAILTPTTPTTAFPLGSIQDPLDMYACDILTIIQALAGVPAISVPAGKDSNGKPIGMQLTGSAFSEDTIAEYAKIIEMEMN
jgi:aspartyl-tRNA(Asn)/glutamyl-tRNA(Gln) amidotransferase subunit A